jgi:hypothetical protein
VIPRARTTRGGFTLLEILVALTVLAVGGVSVIAVFAAAVKLQYKSIVEEQVSLLLEPLHQIAQDRVDGFVYTEEKPVPDAIERTEVVESPGYEYEMTFEAADKRLALPGEGYWVKVLIHPPGGGKPVSPPRLWFIKRHVYTKEELEHSVTYDEEKVQQDNSREREKDEREFR